jgi:dihydroneopterin aldolase
METVIELNSMRFYAYHGVCPQETNVGNYFVVDISYSCPMDKAFASDDIHDIISYADVYNAVKKEMERPSRLIEHLANRILQALVSTFPRLSYLKIKLSKLNPPLGGEVHSASVVIEKRFS